jgi:transposase
LAALRPGEGRSSLIAQPIIIRTRPGYSPDAYEKGGVDSDVFIEFLKRLLAGAKRPTYLIIDRGAAHISKKTKDFVKTLGDSFKLSYLPPYAPDRNPDELVWKHLKADTTGRMVTADKVDFKSKVVSSMRSLQRNHNKIRSFYQKPSL